MASGDDEGRVVVWEALSAEEYRKRGAFEQPEEGPCTGVAMRGGRLVAAFSSGQLRFFCLQRMQPWLCVQAHSRFVSALTLHASRGIFATAAEDATVHVWSLPRVDAKAQVLLSGTWVDQMVTGVAFGSDDSVVAAAYDCDDLFVWCPPLPRTER